METVLAILLLVSGLALIAMVLDWSDSRSKIGRKDAKALKSENVRLRKLVDQVRSTSALAITTGDPVAHELVIEQIDRAEATTTP